MNTESTEVMTAEELETRTTETINEHKGLIVQCDEDHIIALESLKILKTSKKKVEAYWKKPVELAWVAHKELVRKKNELLEPLDKVYNQLAQSASKYLQEKERLAQIEQAKEAARLQKIEDDKKIEEAEALEENRQHEEAEQVLDEPTFAPPPPMKSAPKVSGVSFTEHWKFTIENKAKIPLEYMEPNTVQIGQIVRAMKGNTNIPGIKVHCDKTPNVR